MYTITWNWQCRKWSLLCCKVLAMIFYELKFYEVQSHLPKETIEMVNASKSICQKNIVALLTPTVYYVVNMAVKHNKRSLTRFLTIAASLYLFITMSYILEYLTYISL